MASVCRIACVRIGRFATGVLTGGQAVGRSGGKNTAPPSTALPPYRPTALFADVRGASRVVACDAEASRRGITAGMALAEAKALAADLVVSPYDAEALACAALNVSTALLAASPRVAWEGGKAVGRYGGMRNEGVWWADAAGLGEEARFAQRLLRIGKGLDFGRTHVGIADSAIAAYAATFRPPTALPPYRLTALVPSGCDAAFLGPFPIAILDLDEDLADTFRALGLHTIGRLAALEPGEVEARFGPAGLAAHRLACGLDPRGPSTPRDDEVPAVECDLGGAVATAEPLLFALKGALASLGAALRAKGLAAREVTLALRLDDGATAVRAVRPARPTSHAGALFDHCRAALEDWRLPAPIAAFAVRAALTVPASGEQGDLLAPRWADPAALEAAFERIRGSEGTDAVAIPEARDGHLPEDAGTWAVGRYGGKAVRTSETATALPPYRLTALRRLVTPAPVRVRLGRAGLEAFRHAETWHDVVAWSGPERLAGRWWRSDAPAGSRDYYTARTREGGLWLLFRSAKQRAWFVEGWWD